MQSNVQGPGPGPGRILLLVTGFAFIAWGVIVIMTGLFINTINQYVSEVGTGLIALIIIQGVFSLVVGVLGVKLRNNRGKAAILMALGALIFILFIIGGIAGSFGTETWIALVISACYIAGAYLNNKAA